MASQITNKSGGVILVRLHKTALTRAASVRWGAPLTSRDRHRSSNSGCGLARETGRVPAGDSSGPCAAATTGPRWSS